MIHLDIGLPLDIVLLLIVVRLLVIALLLPDIVIKTGNFQTITGLSIIIRKTITIHLITITKKFNNQQVSFNTQTQKVQNYPHSHFNGQYSELLQIILLQNLTSNDLIIQTKIFDNRASKIWQV